jgi:hypothetical protein
VNLRTKYFDTRSEIQPAFSGLSVRWGPKLLHRMLWSYTGPGICSIGYHRTTVLSRPTLIEFVDS